MSSLGRASLVCLLLLPAAAMADEFDDFRIPEHSVFSWTGSLSGSANHGVTSSVQSEGGSVSGSGSSSLSWLHDSDPRLWAIYLRIQANGQRANNEQSFFLDQDSSHQRSAAEQWTVAVSNRRYPSRLPIALQLDATLIGSYVQNWLNERSRVVFLPSTIDEIRHTAHRQDYAYMASGAATVGAGRVRDATSVYDVLVLERRLRARGILRGPLARRTLERLAQLMYERDDYFAVLDRPGRRFWERAIEILKEDPDFPSELDAVSLLRVLEPYLGRTGNFDFLPTSPIARRRGLFVGAATVARYQASLEHFSESRFEQQTVNGTPQPPLTNEISFDSHGDVAEIDVGPSLEWHRPVGPRWQWDALGNVLFQTRGPGGFDTNAIGSMGWIVADRWLATATVRHFVIVDRAASGVFENFAWQVDVGANLAWYVEDRLQIGIGAHELQGRFGTYRRQEAVEFGIGYRFAGRIESPGLAEPIRVP